MKLYTKITIGLIAGIAVGWLLNLMFNAAPFEATDKDGDHFATMIEILEGQGGLERLRDQEALSRADLNGDGAVDWREIAEYEHTQRADQIHKAFVAADLDRDYHLSANELAAGAPALSVFSGNGRHKGFDVNGDGKLSASEVDMALESEGVSRIEQDLGDMDGDRDKELSRNEIIIGTRGYGRFIDEAYFSKTDLDKNGKLSLRELALEGTDLQSYLNTNAFLRADKDHDGRIALKEEKAVSGWQSYATWIQPVGDIFINLVKMVVVPLVLASLILGAANLGDVRKLGKIGAKAFGFFMLTTAVAVTIGVMAANVMKPGDYVDDQTKTELLSQFKESAGKKVESVTQGPQKTEGEKIMALLVNMVPKNPIKALTEGDMLAIIFFAIFFGICLTLIPEDIARPFLAFMEGLNEVILKMVTLAMELAPYGVFALITCVVADMGVEILAALLVYGLVVVGALLLHVVITHFSFIAFYLKQSPLKFLRAIKEAILLGFSTSSSSATLPISMNVTTANLGVSRQVTSFVLPLGATINMDGTALYQGVAAIFIAQVYGIELSFAAQLTMVLTATLASVGAAGVPGAGMITLAVVLDTAGVPVEGIALIFGLDRLLDMFRTTINIIGDITCASVMAVSEGEELNIQMDQDIIEG